jgi:lipoate-protein ligase A
MSLAVRQDQPMPGQWLMDRDLADLELAAKSEFGPCLSLYQWEVPTLSLGFHQEKDKIDHERLARAGVPLVRRPTGGAAVLHSEELTYSIVIPDAVELRAGQLLLEYVGRAITAGLQAIGVKAELDERGESLSPLANRTSCFARTSRWEIAVNGRKIVGSAQRRLGNALLQHGSILTGNDHLRIVEFLTVSREADRSALRNRLDEKATCVENEIGAGEHIQSLRAALEQAFVDTYEVFERRVREIRTPVEP